MSHGRDLKRPEREVNWNRLTAKLILPSNVRKRMDSVKNSIILDLCSPEGNRMFPRKLMAENTPSPFLPLPVWKVLQEARA